MTNSQFISSNLVSSSLDTSEPVEANNPAIQKLSEELGMAIKAKVDLLKELSKANKESEKLRHSHADHVQKLERELESLQRELDRLYEENEEKEQGKERIKEEYERKLKSQESVLIKYKDKQRELEKSLKEKSQNDKKMHDHLQEIDRLNQLISQSKKKQKEDQDKFTENEGRRAKEVAALNKQIQEEMKKTRQIEAKLEVMRKKLDRKSDENNLLNRKLKDVNMGASTISLRSAHTEDNLTRMNSEASMAIDHHQKTLPKAPEPSDKKGTAKETKAAEPSQKKMASNVYLVNHRANNLLHKLMLVSRKFTKS